MLRAFPKGINSNTDPLLLSIDQLSYAVNVSVRGDFALQRPCFNNVSISPIDGDGYTAANVAANFQTGIFQGCCYYRKGSDGYIMAAIGGNLFKIYPNNDAADGSGNSATASVSQIAPPSVLLIGNYSATGIYTLNLASGVAYKITSGANDSQWAVTAFNADAPGIYNNFPAVIPASASGQVLYLKGAANAVVTVSIVETTGNSQTEPQNWLWQAEQFVIWNDGVNLPVFWDGSNSRRSLGPNPIYLGTTNTNFVAPAVGQFVSTNSTTGSPTQVSLLAAWPTAFGRGTVLVGSAQYNVASYTSGTAGGLATLVLLQLTGNSSDTIGDSVIAPTPALKTSTQYCGAILSAANVSVASANWTGTTWPPTPSGGTSGLTQIAIKILQPASVQASTITPDETFLTGFFQYCGVIQSATANGTATTVVPPLPVAASYASGVSLTIPPHTATNVHGQYYGSTSLAYINVGSLLSCGGAVLTVTSVTFTAYQGVTACVCNVTSASGSSNIYCGTVTIPSTGGDSSATFSGNNQLLYSPSVANQIVLTLSDTSPVISDGNQLVLLNSSNTTIATLSVVAGGVGSGGVITCQTVSGVGATIPTNCLVQNSQGTGSTTYGTVTAQTPNVNVSDGMAIVLTSDVSLPVGKIVQFFSTPTGGGTQNIIAVVTSSTNGTYGAQANQFTLTLSQANSFVAGDTLQVGQNDSTHIPAQLYVVNAVSAYVVKCYMLNTPTVSSIPITTNPTLNSIVQKTSGTASTASVGNYPPASYQGQTFTAIPVSTATSATGGTPVQNNTAAVGDVIQIQVKSSVTSLIATDLFYVVSVSGGSGSTGTSPSITLQNINDTAGNDVAAGTPIYALPELPQGRMGCYGMGRNWMAVTDGTNCNSFVASDIVGSSGGSDEYGFSDAVLKVSQNYALANGTTFKISGAGEQIRAMQFCAQLSVSLGQGPLQIFTDDTVFSCQAPSDATTWATLSSPIVTDGLIGSGGISQDAVLQSNSDLIFRLSDGGVQSMLMATLDFNRWGNTPISNEINRLIQNDDPTLLPYCSLVNYQNRALMTCNPTQQPRGVVHASIASLNYDPISSMAGKTPSVWEGQWSGPAVTNLADGTESIQNLSWQGLNILKLITGWFNGSRKCFALCLSPGGQIQISQILPDKYERNDNTNIPVSWAMTSAFIFNAEQHHIYKRLDDGEIYLKNIGSGGVAYWVFYKADQNTTWTLWYNSTIAYQPNDSGFRPRVGLGQPDGNAFDITNNQPLREGYNFQLLIVFTGKCTFLGGRFSAVEIPQPQFATPQ